MSRRIWGIRDPHASAMIGKDYVEDSDNEQDAEAWLKTSPEDCEIVYSDDGGETWRAR